MVNYTTETKELAVHLNKTIHSNMNSHCDKSSKVNVWGSTILASESMIFCLFLFLFFAYETSK